jgi:hypothetical protein
MSSASLARLLPTVLSLPVGLVSLRMAAKGLSARTWLPFHEAAAGTSFGALAPRLQALILLLVRLVGLGFLVQFLLLAAIPLARALELDPSVEIGILVIGATYCTGLGALNRRLHRETGAATPWKGSFAAAGVLVVAALVAAATS